METHKDIAQLIYKFLKNSIDCKEQHELDTWMARSGRNRKLFIRLTTTRHKKTGEKKKAAEWAKITGAK